MWWSGREIYQDDARSPLDDSDLIYDRPWDIWLVKLIICQVWRESHIFKEWERTADILSKFSFSWGGKITTSVTSRRKGERDWRGLGILIFPSEPIWRSSPPSPSPPLRKINPSRDLSPTAKTIRMSPGSEDLWASDAKRACEVFREAARPAPQTDVDRSSKPPEDGEERGKCGHKGKDKVWASEKLIRTECQEMRETFALRKRPGKWH